MFDAIDLEKLWAKSRKNEPDPHIVWTQKLQLERSARELYVITARELEVRYRKQSGKIASAPLVLPVLVRRVIYLCFLVVTVSLSVWAVRSNPVFFKDSTWNELAHSLLHTITAAYIYLSLFLTAHRPLPEAPRFKSLNVDPRNDQF